MSGATWKGDLFDRVRLRGGSAVVVGDVPGDEVRFFKRLLRWKGMVWVSQLKAGWAINQLELAGSRHVVFRS